VAEGSRLFCNPCRSFDSARYSDVENACCGYCGNKLVVVDPRKTRGAVAVTDAQPTTQMSEINTPFGMLRLAVSTQSTFSPFAYFLREGLGTAHKDQIIEDVATMNEESRAFDGPLPNQNSFETKAGMTTAPEMTGEAYALWMGECQVTVDDEGRPTLYKGTDRRLKQPRGKLEADSTLSNWDHIRAGKHIPATAVRSMVNENFSDDSVEIAKASLGECSQFAWIAFVNSVKQAVEDTHAAYRAA
jgi:hypothetical protein